MLRHPWLHRMAILAGLRAEGLSRVLEDIILLQLLSLETPECSDALKHELVMHHERVRYADATQRY